jgi:hypothetical protein
MRKYVILLVVLMALNTIKAQDTKIVFPRAFAFAIDDFGWNIGDDYGDVDGQGPYRIGLKREMSVADYKAVVTVGEAVGVRIQGLFVLSEMDRLNILGEDPTTTWQGKDWDNTANISNKQIDVMNYVKENAAYLEFGLHGVGHEYWVDGVKKRAEWYCTDDNHPWPEKTMRNHIQYFKDIMAQYGLDEEHGQSFPESFVPCAYGYYWNPKGKYSTGKIMADAGVKYVNTDFSYIEELNPPKGDNGGGFDNGVLVVNRLNYGNVWYKLSKLPTVPVDEQVSDIIESHWSNWLAQDDFVQEQTTKEWIEYYQKVQSMNDRYIAKNTEQFYSQWLYKKYTTVKEDKIGKVEIDNTNMPQEYYDNNIIENMVLKVKLKEGEHVSDALLNNKPISCYFEEAGFGYIYLPMLSKEKYTLEYSVSDKNMEFFVQNKGTYNVYSVELSKKEKVVELRVYGTQDVQIKVDNPKEVLLDNKNMEIIKSDYDQDAQMLTVTVKALDIQGETGKLIMKF